MPLTRGCWCLLSSSSREPPERIARYNFIVCIGRNGTVVQAPQCGAIGLQRSAIISHQPIFP